MGKVHTYEDRRFVDAKLIELDITCPYVLIPVPLRRSTW